MKMWKMKVSKKFHIWLQKYPFYAGFRLCSLKEKIGELKAKCQLSNYKKDEFR